MKTRFTPYDLGAVVANLQHCVGMRATQVYDISPKVYLFKLTRADEKARAAVGSRC
jgi:hypothetical protein